jgi:hypothetical protein
MSTSTRPRPLRATVAALFIAAASLTTAACGEDVVDDGVEQEVEEGVDDVEQEVDENTDTEDDDG